MMRVHAKAALVLLLASCSTPDISTEAGLFADAVGTVSGEYETAVGANADAVREAEIEALVRDRTKTLSLDGACEGYAADTAGITIADCKVIRPELVYAEGTAARAAIQIGRVRDYVEALSLLASSQTEADIGIAAAALIDSVDKLAVATTSKGLIDFAAPLTARKDAIAEVLTFAVRQQRYRLLRKVTSDVDLPLRRILISLTETAVSSGQPSVRDSYEKLRAAQNRMDDTLIDGSDAEYRAAIKAFLAAQEAYASFSGQGLTARLRLIADTHSALAQRLRRPASLEEIVALLEQLKAIQGIF